MEQAYQVEIGPEKFLPAPMQLDEQGTVRRHRSMWTTLRRSMKQNKLSYLALAVLVIVAIASILAFLSPYEPDAINLQEKLQGPSARHWFGTDNFGRDYFTRALYGGRVSLLVGFSAMLCSTALGVIIGTASGYLGGKVDVALMRFTDTFMSVPSFLLMVVINAYLQPGIPTLVVVISAFGWTNVARVTRAETLSLKQREFVLSAKALGVSQRHIIFKHIIPNMTSSIIVAGSLSIASAILTESSLSYLGLGVPMPTASWGNMLQDAQTFILDIPILAVFPGMLILLTVLSFNILGDVLRSALDPKLTK